tara:strand:- start:643 stop:822 length:180 start_codon:yes stop_codon:yes gene_type:complete
MNPVIEYSIYKENAALREDKDRTIEFLDNLYKETLPAQVKSKVAKFTADLRKRSNRAAG